MNRVLLFFVFCLIFPQVVQATACETAFFKFKSSYTPSNRINLALPPRTNIEKALKVQGYTPDYYKGMDSLNEWLAVKKQLQDLNADPRTSYIEYFAQKTKEHLDFAPQALSLFFASHKQKTALAKITAEAKQAISEKRVTYFWWLGFNIWLSEVLSKNENSLDFSKNVISRTEEMATLFPQHVLFPTTLGLLGFMTFNRAFNEGVYPVGLIRGKKKVDDIKMNSKNFLFHDIDHVYLYLYIKRQANTPELANQNYKQIPVLMETLPLEKRKLAELIYFIVIHEFKQVDLLDSRTNREDMANQLVEAIFGALRDKAISKKMIGIRTSSFTFDEEKQKQMIRDSQIVDVFMEDIYDKLH